MKDKTNKLEFNYNSEYDDADKNGDLEYFREMRNGAAHGGKLNNNSTVQHEYDPDKIDKYSNYVLIIVLHIIYNNQFFKNSNHEKYIK